MTTPWIPCSERLPAIDEDVLVATSAYRNGQPRSRFIAYRQEVATVSLHGEPLPDPPPWGWRDVHGEWWDQHQIAFWSPLPEPPE